MSGEEQVESNKNIDEIFEKLRTGIKNYMKK